jgi:fructosamine-3-kinase
MHGILVTDVPYNLTHDWGCFLNAFAEYFDLSHMDSKLERSLARQLASMHDPANRASQAPNGMYGFDVPTHCGETEQVICSFFSRYYFTMQASCCI